MMSHGILLLKNTKGEHKSKYYKTGKVPLSDSNGEISKGEINK